jgi:hypothetical protein
MPQVRTPQSRCDVTQMHLCHDIWAFYDFKKLDCLLYTKDACTSARGAPSVVRGIC